MPELALGVDLAFLRWFWWGKSAFESWVPDVSWLTGAYRPMGLHGTYGTSATSARELTQVCTFTPVAGLHGTTMIVGSTSFYTLLVATDLSERTLAVVMASIVTHFDTVLQGISCQSWSAKADRLVVGSLTVSV